MKSNGKKLLLCIVACFFTLMALLYFIGAPEGRPGSSMSIVGGTICSGIALFLWLRADKA